MTSDPFQFNAGDLVKAVNSDGQVCGKPVDITAGESFTVEIKIPPLHRPELEIVGEALVVKDGDLVVTQAYRASLAQESVQVGRVEIVLKNLQATALTKDQATAKLSKLAGQAVAQAYMDLLSSGDAEKVAAARSMEIGS